MNKSVKKEVLLVIEGSQFSEGVDETIELKTLGTFYQKADKTFLTYKESEVTGFEGTTTTLKIEPGKVTMLRFGKTKTAMIIEEKERHICSYPTPGGFVGLGISGGEITNKLTIDGKGFLLVKYALDYNNTYLSDNELKITIKEASNEDEHDADGKGPNSDSHS